MNGILNQYNFYITAYSNVAHPNMLLDSPNLNITNNIRIQKNSNVVVELQRVFVLVILPGRTYDGGGDGVVVMVASTNVVSQTKQKKKKNGNAAFSCNTIIWALKKMNKTFDIAVLKIIYGWC